MAAPFSNPGDAGSISLTAGGSITLGGLTASAANNGGDITLNAGGDIVSRDTSTSGGLRGGNITLTSSGGGIDTSTSWGETEPVGAAVDASSTTGIGGAITYNAAGPIRPAEQTNTTSNNITFNGPVSLLAIPSPLGSVPPVSMTINGTGGDITFNGTVNGGYSAILAGGPDSVGFLGDVGVSVPLAVLTINGGTEIYGNITTTGTQSYNGALLTSGNAVLTGQELNFAGTVTGSGTLTLQPGLAGQPIRIGGTDSGNPAVLDLTDAEIAFLQAAPSLILGRTDGYRRHYRRRFGPLGFPASHAKVPGRRRQCSGEWTN